MKKFWDSMMEWLPMVWGIIWTGIFTFGSVALLITVAKWLLIVMGVL